MLQQDRVTLSEKKFVALEVDLASKKERKKR